MEPHLAGDTCRLGDEGSSPKPSRSIPSGSASGDFIQENPNNVNHVAFLNAETEETVEGL